MTQEKWPQPLTTADEMIRMDKYYAGGYFAKATAERHDRDAADAARDFAQARRLWSRGDADLPRLRENAR